MFFFNKITTPKCAAVQGLNFDPIPDVGDGYDTDVITHYWEFGLHCWIIGSSEMGITLTSASGTGLPMQVP